MDYFKAVSAHMQGEMDIDGIAGENASNFVISLGCDDLVTWRNLSNNQNGSMELSSDHGFNRIAYHPSGTKFLLGGQSKKVCEFSTVTKGMISTLYEPLGKIADVKYSPSGRYISVASDELKLVIIDTQNQRKMKCRPGHQNKVYNTFFSSKDKYVASIGEDYFVLIYQVFPDKEPQEVFRTKFTDKNVPFGVKGCFADAKEGFKVYVPGIQSLQIIEQLATRWQIKKSNMSHSSNILVAQTISSHCLATSCQKDLCIWSIENQEKLIVLEDSAMLKIIPIANTFIGHRNDGSIYVYNRPLPSASRDQKQIDVEQNESRIEFDENEEENIELEYDQQQEEQIDYEKQVQILTSKKRIADKIVKVYPQGQLSRATSFLDQNRFLYMNLYGCIYETREVDEITTYAEFNRKNQKQPQTKLLFKNKQLKYFDMNSQVVCYASQNQYGLKVDKFSSWEKDWSDIQAVALSGNWMAVANISEIRFIDLAGNLMKVVSFDRPILSMQAYENLLVVVYHESIPMYDSQVLSMKVFSVNQFAVVDLPEGHVPLTVPEFGAKGSTLNWFGFSEEGMLFSQDSFGAIRAYSLQTNQWSPVMMEALSDPKKAWVVGFQNYQMIYWRTTDSEPEPTVRPRLNLKSSKLLFPTLQQNVEQLQSLPYMLWQRYCLDHQLARWRLWGRHKLSRGQKNINYELSSTIKDEKKVYDEHLQLDVELFKIIKFYLKTQQGQRALGFIKSHIRSIQAGKDLIEMLDSCNHRNEAVDLEFFYDQKQREIEYETMQDLALKELKSKVQVSIKAKKDNPMNPKFKRPINNPIPFSMSSQPSQNSSIMEDITHKSQRETSKIEDEIENPFLKKKSTNDRKQEIEDHIEKYGVKRKAEEKKKGQH